MYFAVDEFCRVGLLVFMIYPQRVPLATNREDVSIRILPRKLWLKAAGIVLDGIASPRFELVDGR